MPAYTPGLRAAGAGGYVSVYIRVLPDGKVQDASLVDGDARLTEVTLEAVKKWQFRASTGSSVLRAGTLKFRFNPGTGTVVFSPMLQDILNRVYIPPPPKAESSSR